MGREQSKNSHRMLLLPNLLSLLHLEPDLKLPSSLEASLFPPSINISLHNAFVVFNSILVHGS